MRVSSVVVLVAVCLAATSIPARAGTELEGFSESTVLGGLTLPTALAFLPDGRAVITELDGSLLLADTGAEGGATTLAEIPVAFCGGSDYETGLLGVAVDPAFDENGWLYLYRTVAGFEGPCGYEDLTREQQIVRVTVDGAGEGGPTVDLGSLAVLLDGIRADLPYHCGGCLRIGPDGMLYASTGDTGVGNFEELGPGTSTNPYADDLTELVGKILRLELDGSVPADNPFVGEGGGVREEIFAYGFRNPWRFGFDPDTGRLWVGDVGEDDVEEIDLVEPGSHHGWPRCEGTLPKGCKEKGDAQPAFSYPHEGKQSLGDESGASVTGGAFAPAGFGFQQGAYFFADFEAGNIYRALLKPQRDGIKGKPELFASEAGGVVDLVFGPDASLYYLSLSFFGPASELRRIDPPASGGSQPTAGKRLVLEDGNKKALKLVGKDAIALGGGMDDPTGFGGSVRVTGSSPDEGGGTLFDDTYPLPASGWKLLGKAPDKVKGFKYADTKLEHGPIKSVLVRDGKVIAVTGKLEGLGHTLDAEVGSVLVQLQLGSRTWCLGFGGDTKFKAGKSFSAKNADAPPACP